MLGLTSEAGRTDVSDGAVTTSRTANLADRLELQPPVRHSRLSLPGACQPQVGHRWRAAEYEFIPTGERSHIARVAQAVRLWHGPILVGVRPFAPARRRAQLSRSQLETQTVSARGHEAAALHIDVVTQEIFDVGSGWQVFAEHGMEDLAAACGQPAKLLTELVPQLACRGSLRLERHVGLARGFDRARAGPRAENLQYILQRRSTVCSVIDYLDPQPGFSRLAGRGRGGDQGPCAAGPRL
jgi:hypothetical protein